MACIRSCLWCSAFYSMLWQGSSMSHAGHAIGGPTFTNMASSKRLMTLDNEASFHAEKLSFTCIATWGAMQF